MRFHRFYLALAIIALSSPLHAEGNYPWYERSTMMALVLPSVAVYATVAAPTLLSEHDWRLLDQARDDAALAVASGETDRPMLQQALRRLRVLGLDQGGDDLTLAQWILLQDLTERRTR